MCHWRQWQHRWNVRVFFLFCHSISLSSSLSLFRAPSANTVRKGKVLYWEMMTAQMKCQGYDSCLLVCVFVCFISLPLSLSLSLSLSELLTLSSNEVRKGKVPPPPSCVIGDNDSTDEISEYFFCSVTLSLSLPLSLSVPGSISQHSPERKSSVLGDDDSTDEMSEVSFLFVCMFVCSLFLFLSLCLNSVLCRPTQFGKEKFCCHPLVFYVTMTAQMKCLR